MDVDKKSYNGAINEFVQKFKEKQESMFKEDVGGYMKTTFGSAYNYALCDIDDVINKIAEEMIMPSSSMEVIDMKNESYLVKVCEGCDYSPALCDGDVCTCESASLHGANSEIGRRNGAFEKKEFKRELEPFF